MRALAVNRIAASGCVLVSFLMLAPALARGENWPQWRGPHNDGISTETNLPAEWSETKNIAWKLKLPGMGGSTPVVWGDRIFVTSADGKDLVLLCVGTDGKVLWKGNLGTGDRPWQRNEANNASPSPCTDGRHVWAMDGTGELVCFDFAGKEAWRCNLQDRYGAFRQQWGGMHMSPLLEGDRLYLSFMHQKGAWVVALDKAKGAEVWKIERKSDASRESKDSYASPTLAHSGKDAFLITHGADYTIAHRLSDGGEIWRVGDLNYKDKYRGDWRLVASPGVSNDLIVIPTAKTGGVVAVKPDAHGLVLTGSEYEIWRKQRGTPDVPCPLIHDGLVYLCRDGIISCLEAKTGQELYEQRIHAARYRGSPVYADGKIYLTARDGVVTVVKAGPKFERLAENKLPDQIAASPAISGGRIYFHGFETLFAIGQSR